MDGEDRVEDEAGDTFDEGKINFLAEGKKDGMLRGRGARLRLLFNVDGPHRINHAGPIPRTLQPHSSGVRRGATVAAMPNKDLQFNIRGGRCEERTQVLELVVCNVLRREELLLYAGCRQVKVH